MRDSDTTQRQGLLSGGANRARRGREFGRENELSLLEKLYEKDLRDEENRRYLAFEGFAGATSTRVRTDFPFLIIVGFALAGLLGYFALVMLASPSRLIHGLDFRARACGLDSLEARPLLYYLLPNIDMNLKMCLSSCPSATNLDVCLYRPDGVLTHSLPEFCYTTIQARPAGKFCVPVEKKTRETVVRHLNSASEVAGRFLGDIFSASDLILVAFLVARAVSGIFFAFFARISALKPALYISLFLAPAAFLLAALAFHRDLTARQAAGDPTSTPSSLSILRIVALAVAGVVGFAVLIFFHQLQLAARALGRSRRVIGRMGDLRPAVLVVEVFGAFCFFLLIFFFVKGFAGGQRDLVDSSVISGGKLYVFTFSSGARMLLIPSVICLVILLRFGNNFFIGAVTMTYVRWYFSRQKEKTPLAFSAVLGDLLRFHMGSVALLTLQEVLFFIPSMFSYLLVTLLKNMNQKSDFTRFCLAICRPVIAVEYKSFRFINPDFFIETALNSSGIYEGRRKIFFLHTFRNRSMDFNLLSWIGISLRLYTLIFTSIFGGLLYFLLQLLPFSLVGVMKFIDIYSYPLLLFIIAMLLTSTAHTKSIETAFRVLQLCRLIDLEMFVGSQLYMEDLFTWFSDVDKDAADLDPPRLFGIRLAKKKEVGEDNQVQVAYQLEDNPEHSHPDEKDKIEKFGDPKNVESFDPFA